MPRLPKIQALQPWDCIGVPGQQPVGTAEQELQRWLGLAWEVWPSHWHPLHAQVRQHVQGLVQGMQQIPTNIYLQPSVMYETAVRI